MYPWQESGKKVGTKRRSRGHSNEAAKALRILQRPFDEVIDRRERQTSAARDVLTSRCRDDTCRGTFKERYPKRFLDKANLDGERRLRNMAAPGGFAKVPEFVEGRYIFKLPQGRSISHWPLINTIADISTMNWSYWAICSKVTGSTRAFAMDQFLKSLRNRKAIVEARIDEERARPAPDGFRLHALKKLSLQFREQIAFVERTNRQLAT